MDLTHFTFEVDGAGVATVLMDRRDERMNTLGPALFDDMNTILDRLEHDDEIVAVVWGSAKPDNFLAGADIRFFQTLTDAKTAEDAIKATHAMFARIEALHTERGKPVVAAIHGACLGGGNELALTASMRIATDDPKTQLGQPEVKLGVIPAGGGTQRLPDLIGIAAALDLILTGRSLRPHKARKIGLVDEVVPPQVLLDVARTRALEATTAKPDGGSIKSFLSPDHLQQLALEQNPMGRRVLFKKAEERMLAETHGNYPAPQRALEAVKIGVEQGHEAGYAAEARFFGELVVSPESKALRSIFFATQELKKDPGVDGKVEPKEVRKVGILGGGLMGSGIATVSALKAGSTVRIKEIDDAGIDRALAYVHRNVDKLRRRRRVRDFEAERLMHKVTGTTDWSGFENVDLVIEAVFEDLSLKRKLLAEAEGVVPDDAVFASNTSSLPISSIAEGAQRPELVLGMHYFSPVEKMPLLEVIRAERTSDVAVATAVAYGKRQGKTVIVVGDGTGFYTTRILAPYSTEAAFLLEEGASVEAIDRAMVKWGFPVGPMLLMDEVGIDVGAKIAKIMVEAYGERMAGPAMMERLIDADRRGRKNRKGFYRYDDKGERDGVDESVYEVLGLGPHRDIPAAEIQERLSLAMINEAALCLQEGILRSARDGDIGAVMGLGFPPFRGGPFWYVDEVGAAEIVDRLDALAERFGERFAAAQILRDHATSGERFRS